jgi:hypothetical protein
MPGTFDNRLAQFSFSERAARVGAGVIDRVKSSVHVEDRNPDPIDFNRSSCAGRNLVREGHFHKIVHDRHLSLRLLYGASEGRLLDFSATLWHRNSSE